MAVSVAKVFEGLEDAKASLSAEGKERVFKVARAGADGLVRYVIAKNADAARSKLSKFLGDQVIPQGDPKPPKDKADSIAKKVQSMTPEEQLKLRELLAQMEGSNAAA